MIKVKVNAGQVEKELFNTEDKDTPSGLYENKDYFILVPNRADNEGEVFWISKCNVAKSHTYITKTDDKQTALAWLSDSSITISN
jgi:hypothetical protein